VLNPTIIIRAKTTSPIPNRTIVEGEIIISDINYLMTEVK